ncbi:MAG: hypothetical protein KJO35_08150 [Gammaproteobacteria bacterium]|nr:hypothetical protein [Gammaproteobacteria bacterium]
MMNSITKNQSGAALIVSLILLLILTVIAVVGMSTATLELAMAGNMQYQNTAFEAAESIVEAEIMRPDLVPPTAPGVMPLTAANVNRDYKNPADRTLATATATTSYLGPTGTTGWQLGGATSFSAFHFEVNGVATAAQGAAASHRQGFFVVGPSL